MQAARPPSSSGIGPAPRILIVEDDLDLAADMEAVLHRYGFQTEVVRTQTAALDRAGGVDLVLLDLSLLGGEALETCARLAAHTALVVISERVEEGGRVAALEVGADDYMTKPLPLRELVARCRAVLRRTGTKARGSVVRIGELEIDIERYEVRCRHRPLSLTTKELALLVALARHLGTLVRREDLAEEVWGAGLWSIRRSLDVHMSSLRRKLGDSPHQPRYIQTVHGLGFRLLPQDAVAEEPTAEPFGPRDPA